ncbi:uncharacterized protein TNCV_1628231 [Trichonephila clavipes]|nr:uncharacterized protein TNCV_1628231 [Trichonephila clavipes]
MSRKHGNDKKMYKSVGRCLERGSEYGNLHEVIESQRDSPKWNVFCAISRRKVYGTFVFGEPTVTGSANFDVVQLWLIPQLKESEPDNFIWQQEGALPHWNLSVSFAWPPRSPDLISCDFYLWSFINDCVYVPPLPADLPDLRHRIDSLLQELPQLPSLE